MKTMTGTVLIYKVHYEVELLNEDPEINIVQSAKPDSNKLLL
jgi:hypothetical protein